MGPTGDAPTCDGPPGLRRGRSPACTDQGTCLDPGHGCSTSRRSHERRGTPLRLHHECTMERISNTWNNEDEILTQYPSSLYMKGVMARF